MAPPQVPELYIVLHLVQVVIVLLVLRYADVYERESWGALVLLFIWGAVSGPWFAGPLNGRFLDLLPADVAAVLGPAVVAPVVEETLKGGAVVAAMFVAIWFSRRFGFLGFDGVSDGIVYGAAVGLGFTFAENLSYFLNASATAGSFAVGMDVFLARVDFAGFQALLHPSFTAAFGAGLGLAVVSRSRFARVALPAAGLVIAVLAHALWNGLPMLALVRQFGLEHVAATLDAGTWSAGFEVAFSDALAGTRTLAVIYLGAAGMAFATWLGHERRIIASQLGAEAQAGAVTDLECDQVPRIGARVRIYLSLLHRGRLQELRALRLLHDRLAALALLRWRIERVGGDGIILDRLRAEVAALRTYHRDVAALGQGVERRFMNGQQSIPLGAHDGPGHAEVALGGSSPGTSDRGT